MSNKVLCAYCQDDGKSGVCDKLRVKRDVLGRLVEVWKCRNCGAIWYERLLESINKEV